MTSMLPLWLTGYFLQRTNQRNKILLFTCNNIANLVHCRKCSSCILAYYTCYFHTREKKNHQMCRCWYFLAQQFNNQTHMSVWKKTVANGNFTTDAVSSATEILILGFNAADGDPPHWPFFYSQFQLDWDCNWCHSIPAERCNIKDIRPNMMTSSNGSIFRITGPLCWEFPGHRWIPPTKANDAELWCFLWSAPE